MCTDKVLHERDDTGAFNKPVSISRTLYRPTSSQ